MDTLFAIVGIKQEESAFQKKKKFNSEQKWVLEAYEASATAKSGLR